MKSLWESLSNLNPFQGMTESLFDKDLVNKDITWNYDTFKDYAIRQIKDKLKVDFQKNSNDKWYLVDNSIITKTQWSDDKIFEICLIHKIPSHTDKNINIYLKCEITILFTNIEKNYQEIDDEYTGISIVVFTDDNFYISINQNPWLGAMDLHQIKKLDSSLKPEIIIDNIVDILKSFKYSVDKNEMDEVINLSNETLEPPKDISKFSKKDLRKFYNDKWKEISKILRNTYKSFKK